MKPRIIHKMEHLGRLWSSTWVLLEEHSERCLSGAIVNNHYNVIESSMAESQSSWTWSPQKVIYFRFGI